MADTKTVLIQDDEYEKVIKVALRIITDAIASSTAHIPKQDRDEFRRLMIEDKLLHFWRKVKRDGRSKGEVLDPSALRHVYNTVAYFSNLLDDEAV